MNIQYQTERQHLARRILIYIDENINVYSILIYININIRYVCVCVLLLVVWGRLCFITAGIHSDHFKRTREEPTRIRRT
jgi:hypothetical protein